MFRPIELGKAPCAELPNDNPALHEGAIWVCLETTGVASAELPVAPTAVIADAAPTPVIDEVDEPEAALEIEVVDELPPLDETVLDTVDEQVAEEAPHPKSKEPFSIFVAALADVVVTAGGDGMLMRAVLGEQRLDGESVPEAIAMALVDGGVLERGAKGLARTEAFTETALAWAAVLRGECDDFGACGPRMLDEWASDLVARVLAAPGRAEQLRRDLRKRGVAAFGLLDAA